MYEEDHEETHEETHEEDFDDEDFDNEDFDGEDFDDEYNEVIEPQELQQFDSVPEDWDAEIEREQSENRNEELKLAEIKREELRCKRADINGENDSVPD